MKVILARTAGFCKGVRRAMNMVLEASQRLDGEIITEGPLIHNPQTIEILERRKIRVMRQGELPGPGENLFIRTHGVSPERRQELRATGVNICDATCPDVARIQGLIKRHVRQGFRVVIVGDKGHAEVIGLAGNAGDQGDVVGDPAEVAGLPEAEKVCVVAQSTLEPELFERVAAAVRARYPETVVLNTICPSTHNRQEELRRLAQEAEVVVVVGGRNSANTRRLMEISRSLGVPTLHVETADELDPRALSRFRSAAVTAGASTPNWILMQVVTRLQEIEPAGSPRALSLARQLVRFVVRSSIYVALGSALLTNANARLLGVNFGWAPYAVAFCYILSVHLLSHLTDHGAFELDNSPRLAQYHRHGRLFLTLSVVAALLSVVFAATAGVLPLLLMLALCALGLVYRINLSSLIGLPRWAGGASLRSPLHLIPASKDLFMALGWSLVTVFMPLLMTGLPVHLTAVALTFAVTFLLVIVRSLFFDIRDIQGDKIVGRETLPTIIGTRGTKLLILALTGLQVLLLVAGAWLGALTSFAWPMLAVTGFICLYLLLYHRRVIYQGLEVEMLGDTQFILAGLLAWLPS